MRLDGLKMGWKFSLSLQSTGMLMDPSLCAQFERTHQEVDTGRTCTDSSVEPPE